MKLRCAVPLLVVRLKLDGVRPVLVKVKLPSPPTVRLITVIASSWVLAKVQVTCSPGLRLIAVAGLPLLQVTPS